MCRRFSARARSYMLTYKHIALSDLSEAGEGLGATETNITPREEGAPSMQEIEKIRKKFKVHRDANTIDAAFIEQVMREIILL